MDKLLRAMEIVEEMKKPGANVEKLKAELISISPQNNGMNASMIQEMKDAGFTASSYERKLDRRVVQFRVPGYRPLPNGDGISVSKAQQGNLKFDAKPIDPVAEMSRAREALLTEEEGQSARNAEGLSADDLLHLIRAYQLSSGPDANINAAEAEFSKVSELGARGAAMTIVRHFIEGGLRYEVDVEKERVTFDRDRFEDYLQFERMRRAFDRGPLPESKSTLMGSTTLSDNTIQQIIICFLSNESIRNTAKIVGVSKKSISLYFDKLLIKLCAIGYYKLKYYFEITLRNSYPEILSDISGYASKQLKRHRGFSSEEKFLMYEAKYCTEMFYRHYLADAQAHEDSDEIMLEVMKNDVLHLIRLTGPLNGPPFNLTKAEDYVREALIRRLPRNLKKQFKIDADQLVRMADGIADSRTLMPDVMCYFYGMARPPDVD